MAMVDYRYDREILAVENMVAKTPEQIEAKNQIVQELEAAWYAERLGLAQKYGKEVTDEDEKTAQDMARTRERMLEDVQQSTMSNYAFERKLLKKKYDEYAKVIKDQTLLDKWYAAEQLETWLKSDKAFAVMTRSLQSEWKSATDQMVSDFVAGEDIKTAVSDMTKQTLINTAQSTAQQMFQRTVDYVIETIGLLLGLGASGSGGWGAVEGGFWGAMANIGSFLAMGIGSMLAARAMSSAFYAEGGWMAGHPYGGFIREGSGAIDDVFLGAIGKTLHYGMGGEYVVNK
jgi:hypothetical protein